MVKKNPTTIEELVARNPSLSAPDGILESLEKVSTGVLSLDTALEGGLPVGKMAELYGPPGGGKSALAMSTAAQAQKRGAVVWFDLEDAFNPVLAERAGIDMSKMVFGASVAAESVFETIEDASRLRDISLIVIDSVAGLVPNAEIQGDFGDSHVGLIARLLSQALRKMSQTLSVEHSDVIVLWVNQVRDLINSFGHGPQTTTTGGRGLKFWCSTRIEVTRIGAIKQGDDVVGQDVRCKVVKSRFSRPFQTTNFSLLYESGISNGASLIDLAIKEGIIQKKGSWLVDAVTGESLGQGTLNYARVLDSDVNEYESLLAKL